jgi:hypothetical protein
METDSTRPREPDPDIEAASEQEILRRMAELDAGTVKSVPWSVVSRKLENSPEFLERIARARQDLREGKGVRLEDVQDTEP